MEMPEQGMEEAPMEEGAPVGASNPIVKAIGDLQKFALVLREKGDPKGEALIEALKMVGQALGGEAAPEAAPAPAAAAPRNPAMDSMRAQVT